MTRAIVWFRRDLSLDDNPAFAAATTHDEVACVWVLEPPLMNSAGPLRQSHVIAAVRSLDEELRRRGGRLVLLEGPASGAIPRVAQQLGAVEVFWNGDVTNFAQARDAAVGESLERAKISSRTSWGTLVQPPGSILTQAGTVPRVFKRFHDLWSTLPVPVTPVSGGATLVSLDSEVALPEIAPPPVDVGARAARRRLDSFVSMVDDYESTRDRPDCDATSHLSTDLRFGTISPRRVAFSVGTASAGRRAFVRQLAWRDWYAHLFFERPELAWRVQNPALESVQWRNDPAEIDAWFEGRTGYPIVDAAMRELSATGWMHNRLRMIVASFLVKDLLVDWRVGERHFRRLLIDGDVAQNAGNWQWSAGTGPDAAPYFRVMNPTTQGRRFDPDGDYVRRWLPELARLAGASIHAPSELGPLELAAAGIDLGVHYPEPIVDHARARVRVMEAYGDATRASRGEARDV